MGRTLGLVDISSHGGSAYAGRLARRRLGGYALLEWLVRRLSECQSLDEVVVLADERVDPQSLEQFALGGVPIVESDGRDPLAHALRVVREQHADAAVRIRLSQPFVDPELIDRLAAAARVRPWVDYVGYASSLGFSRAQMGRVGMFGEWCSAAALEQAHQAATSRSDRQTMTAYILRHPGEFEQCWLQPPEPLDRNDLRLVVDIEDDWDHADVILEALGGDCLDWQSIVGLLDRQPAIRHEMARLNSVQSGD